MISRHGTTTYTWSKGPFEQGDVEPGSFPHVLGWNYEQGYTWSMQDMVGSQYWLPEYNPYASDIIINMIFYSTGRKLPEDVVLVRELRDKYLKYNLEKSLLLSVLEFAEKFGANANKLVNEMNEVDEGRKEGDSHYLSQEYEAAFADFSEAIDELRLLNAKAVRLKDEALLWIYVVEWLSVTGAAIISGSVLWTLMVRRRAYRAVGTTRLEMR
jgi:hypothetical protein